MKRYILILGLFVIGSCVAMDLKPTFRDISYGADDCNTLDIYSAQTSSLSPILVYIHGGAFMSGDKVKNLPQALVSLCLDAGISVVSINYRLSSSADYSFTYSEETPVPPAFQDAARALQFIRYNAETYRMDPTRLAVSGGSAGGGLALWLAFADDGARPDDPDPVCRESTRPTSVVAMYAQTTYDPEYMLANMSYDGYQVGWLNKLFQASKKQLKSSESQEMRQAVSPIDLVDAEDQVTVFMGWGGEDPVTPDLPQAKFVHNSIFYRELEKKLIAYEIPYEWVLNSDYTSGKRTGNVNRDAVLFLKQTLHLTP